MSLLSNILLRTASSHLIKSSVCFKWKRSASTYEGDGKTSAKVLNRDLDYLMVNSYSNIGFVLNNGVRLLGPSILFPRSFLSWNINDIADVTEDSLVLFSLVDPKLDFVVLGFGDQGACTPEIRQRIKNFSVTHNIGFELLSTDNAVATYNYLNHERRFVAGAFIPPSKVEIYDDRDIASSMARQQILNME